jgi:hypothetical protein
MSKLFKKSSTAYTAAAQQEKWDQSSNFLSFL